MPISTKVSLKTDIRVSTRNTEREAFCAEGDRVFTYQLIKIAERKWKKIVTINDFYPKAAYLNNDSKDKDDKQVSKIKASSVNAADLLGEDSK